MYNRILIIGADSFIARQFILDYSLIHRLVYISRVETGLVKEYVLQDFHEIDPVMMKDIDVVLNFAAIVHRPDIRDANIYHEINHTLTLINARKAKQAGVKLFIQMSTIAVYGNASAIDRDTPVNPQNPYANSKCSADEDLLAIQDTTFKVAIVRPPMVYGGGKAPGNMMRLIALAYKGIPMPFKGIENHRDFINVKNLVQYLHIIIEKQLNGIYLLTDNQPVSTEYLIKIISKYLDKNPKLIKLPGWSLKILRYFRPEEFNKLFGTSLISPDFPYENLIHRFTVDNGVREMVETFIAFKSH